MNEKIKKYKEQQEFFRREIARMELSIQRHYEWIAKHVTKINRHKFSIRELDKSIAEEEKNEIM